MLCLEHTSDIVVQVIGLYYFLGRQAAEARTANASIETSAQNNEMNGNTPLLLIDWLIE